jgi:hypothetical protein
VRSDELVQYGLGLVRSWKPLAESDRLQLEADFNSGRPLRNPIRQQLEADLWQFATDANISTEEVRGLTSQLLYNFIKPGWAWENYKF